QRVRKAVAHALDRDLMDQRLTDGTGQPTSALLAEASRFYDGQEGPTYDPERATELVEEVKADTGRDGAITILISDGPENVEAGVVTKALLDAAGFNVTIENAPVSQVTARQFTGDYEVVIEIGRASCRERGGGGGGAGAETRSRSGIVSDKRGP